MGLSNERCTPCRTGEGKLGAAEIAALLPDVPGWEVAEESSLVRRWKFRDFAAALEFVNRVGALAEAEDHHPDIRFGWGYTELHIITHSAGGLTRNDFIMAAKIG
jgi:4a-hydroxytetrahydrobiopterin dehydratase